MSRTVADALANVMGTDTSRRLPPRSTRIGVIREAIEKGERNDRLLDGRDFDARYWQNARRQLSMLERHLSTLEGQLEAFAAVIDGSADS